MRFRFSIHRQLIADALASSSAAARPGSGPTSASAAISQR